MLFRHLDRHRDLGLLILRIGIGAMFIGHGYPKLVGGPEVWTRLGGALALLGFPYFPTFMGFMAALSETLGGLLLILGFFTRPALVFLLGTMVVAAGMHLAKGDGFTRSSHAIEAAILFFSLILIGPGRFSLDERIARAHRATMRGDAAAGADGADGAPPGGGGGRP